MRYPISLFFLIFCIIFSCKKKEYLKLFDSDFTLDYTGSFIVIDSLTNKDSYFVQANNEEKDPIIQITKIKGEKDRLYDQWLGLMDQIVDDPNANFIKKGNDKSEYFVYSDKDDQDRELFTTCYLLSTDIYAILISYSSYTQKERPLVFKGNQVLL